MLLDLSDINTLNALYISISIGISLKFLWAWKVKYHFMDSVSDSANAKVIHHGSVYKVTNRLTPNFILRRIVKYIRRKKYSQDDAEEPISCCFRKA